MKHEIVYFNERRLKNLTRVDTHVRNNEILQILLPPRGRARPLLPRAELMAPGS